MASPASNQGCVSDIRKVGYLRKPKSMHKRFFVLRTASISGPSRLEYYENERKWRHKSGAPKRSISLESCFNINKRADSKNKYLVAMYTKDECFAIAADCEQERDVWYEALVDLHNRDKVHKPPGGSLIGEDYGEAIPGPAFKEVWQVILKPKGLGQAKNLVGIYRLCLTNKTISFVKLNSDAASVVLQLMNIRRCGHSENFFFIEVGRSSVTGPGEFWMQVQDSVVAQNMHETILEAMKAMSEGFHPRSKSQCSSNCSNPISVPVRRHHHNNLPPSQVGLGRRSRAESIAASSPAGPGKQSHSFRVRAASDGEETMSRPASVDGSFGSPFTGRTHSQRHRGSSRLHPPLNHSRSIPMPSSHCSPSAISPVSLSSSSTSGHGSTPDCMCPHRSSASVSGSPSDGGFISSDECGSSPCDFSGYFRSGTPESLGRTPPAKEDELRNYMSMDPPGPPHRGHRCLPAKLEDQELEKGFRKRTHSSGTSPPTVYYQMTPLQSSMASLDEYTVMMPLYQPSQSRAPTCRQSAFMPKSLYPEEGLNLHFESGRVDQKNDGYMPMSPGVALVPSKSNDYVPMSPKNVLDPQQISYPDCRVDSNGYMMMSPSGDCSPDKTSYGKMWTNVNSPKMSVESSEVKVSYGDYFNMSPTRGSTTSTTPDFIPAVEPPKPIQSYSSWPRSFRRSFRKCEQSPLHSQLAFDDDDNDHISSDNLRGQGNEQQVVKLKQGEANGGLTRPTCLSLDDTKASTLPRTREKPFLAEPKNLGEYIEVNNRPFSASTASLSSPVFAEEGCVAAGLEGCSYVSMQLGGPCSACAEASLMSHYSAKGVLAAKATDRPVSPTKTRGPGARPCSVLQRPMLELSAFSRVCTSPNRNQCGRVVRVDPQGRRRHSSETFLSLGSPPAPSCVEAGTSESFASSENVCLKPGDPAGCRAREMPRNTGKLGTTTCLNGLNDMNVDLLKGLEKPEWNSHQPKASRAFSTFPLEDSGMYTSICFHKPVDMEDCPAESEAVEDRQGKRLTRLTE